MTHSLVATVMRDCARNVGVGLLALAALIGVLFVAPTIGNWIAAAWFGWARILTSNYTSVTAAALTEWISLIGVVWAVCVTVKVAKTDEVTSFWFAGLAAAITLLGLIPSHCALYAITDDWTRDQVHSFVENGAVVTVMLVSCLFVISPVALIVWAIDASRETTNASHK